MCLSLSLKHHRPSVMHTGIFSFSPAWWPPKHSAAPAATQIQTNHDLIKEKETKRDDNCGEIEIGTPERTRAWTLGAVGWASRMLSARIRMCPPYAPLPLMTVEQVLSATGLSRDAYEASMRAGGGKGAWPYQATLDGARRQAAGRGKRGTASIASLALAD